MRGRLAKALRGLARGAGMGDMGYRAVKQSYPRMIGADRAQIQRLCREWWARRGVYHVSSSAEK